MLRRALAGVGLAHYFGPVVCSCELGVAKPDNRIFAAAIAALAGGMPATAVLSQAWELRQADAGAWRHG